ncbi:ABC transporter substrate-binding protein [Actinomadura rayongensis]|uniref:Uncharacterized protein n=1 Tax=Actinomadura rayongensis TaxID=1429076 RepID=A0A6I4W7K9_9ACTN|nr:ABC transporter substrate-binding protein [Actinomadura rayongensis]MXQ64720.1 hypothetical protein [Actinomadura rayongensis]
MSMSGAEPWRDRLEGLESLFERLRERPRARTGDRLRPLLVLRGTDEDDHLVTHQLVERCRVDGGPVGHLAGEDGARDLPLVLRHLVRQLSSGTRRGEPALRFPLLSMALWLLEVRGMRLLQDGAGRGGNAASSAQRQAWRVAGELAAAEEEAHRRRILRRGLLRRRQIVVPGERPGQQGRLASALGHLEQVAPIGVALVALASTTIASVVDLAAALLVGALGLSAIAGQVAARTRDRAGRRRYHWFTSEKQTYLRGNRSDDFLGFALDLIYRDEPRAGPDETVERLLVAAFLQDLRQAYRRRPLRRAAWARVRYPVVVLGPFAAGAGEPARRFVERVEEIRRAELRFDPLVLVVAVTSEEEAARIADAVRIPLGDTGAVDLGDLRETPDGQPFWHGYENERRRASVQGTRRTIRVDLRRGDGASTLPVFRGRRRPRVAHPALPWLAMGVIVAASVAVISFEAVRYCVPFDVWRAGNGECVGITDGSKVFAGRLAAVEGRIRRQNEAVVGSGKPYVTVVYLGAMTVDPADTNPQAQLMADTHGELIGLSMAQQERNANGGLPQLRILLANAGSRFRYGADVAARIRDLAARDRHVVAVVGFAQSMRQTNDAIDVLGRSALPMIGTASTFDGMGEQDGRFSPYYFRLAPPNRREAEVAAYWANSGRLSVGNGPGTRAKRADVFYDSRPDDLYTRNLAADFARAFHGTVTQRPYSDPSQLPGAVIEACKNDADLFYYAGRSQEFRLFLDRIANTGCGGRRIVLADDDVIIYVSDNAADLGRNQSVRLYVTPHAAREEWTPPWVGPGYGVHTFFSSFDTVVDRLVGPHAPANERPSLSHAALGFDAVLAVVNAAERVYGEHGRTLPSSAAVLSELTQPGPGARPQGATGPLTFGSRDGGHEVEDKPVLLTRLEDGGRLTLVAMCGDLLAGRRNDAHPTLCPPRTTKPST